MKRKILTVSLLLLALCVMLSSCGIFDEKPCEHTYADRVVPPTCSEDGYTEHVCTKCNSTYSDSTVEKLPHVYVTTVVPPTCTAEGYNDNNCTECGHNYKDVFTQKVIHPYKSIVVSPTCSTEGYTEHICLVCDDSYKDAIIPTIPHTYEEEIISPTCSTEGYTKHTCSVCGDTYNDSTTAMTSHRFNDAPCTYCSLDEITESITPVTDWYSADNIQFTVTSAEELAGLAALVNSGTDFSNQVVNLEADIDLGYTEWIPIGNEDHPFNGTFNGKGHNISGLKINASYSYVGLFGKSSGEIKNLEVADASVFVKDSYSYVSVICGYSTAPITEVKVSGFIDACSSDYVGGIAGSLSLSTAFITKNESYAEITGGDYTGGIAGYVTASGTLQTDMFLIDGSITGCQYVGGIFGCVSAKIGSTVYGANVCADVLGECYVGGIVGNAENVSVTTCSNEGATITATSYLTSGDRFFAYLGGYVGKGYSVDNCLNNADILYNSRGSYVGGVAGHLINSAISCENNGKITGYDYVGGVVGGIDTTSALAVSKLKNSGDVSGKTYVGGIVGMYLSTADTTLSELENNGTITGTGFDVGGVIGSHKNGTATLIASGLSNVGDVVGEEYSVGGIFGYAAGSTSSVLKNSSSSSNIIGKYNVGGIIGYTPNVTVKGCTNDGSSVTAIGWCSDTSTDYAYLGGYVGRGYSISGCTNNSDITYNGTGIYVGGIVGYAVNSINDCTNNGNVTSASDYIGGIAGFLDTSTYYNLTYKNLSNAGNVIGKNNVAGIIGAISQSVEVGVKYHLCSKNSSNIYYDVKTNFNSFKNTGNVMGKSYVGGILGKATFDNKLNYYDKYCCYICETNYHIGRSFLNATGLENEGIVFGESCLGELYGYFKCDGEGGLKSTVTTYTVTGSVTVNGETLEGIYDVGSNTNLTLTGREVYVPASAEDDTETSEPTNTSETGSTE